MQIIQSITEELRQKTKNKFLEWDKVLKEEWLEGSPEQQDKAYELLEDPTIYAYAFFRDDNGDPIRLYPYQDLILNDPSKRIIFAAANQIGKSFSLLVMALHFAITNPGKTVLLTSKTLPQSKDLLRQIKNMLRNSILDQKFDIGATETSSEIYLKHFEERKDKDGKAFIKELSESRIICVPATEAALGYAVDLAGIDELGFYQEGEHFFGQILEPRTYGTKGKIVVFSNPNGQQGILWTLWNSKRFSKYRFNFFDKPGNTQEEFDDYSESKTKEQIDSTLLAVFTDAEGSYISVPERKAMQEERSNILPLKAGRPLYVFFDFAKVKDRTVRAIGELRGEGPDSGVFVHELKEYPDRTPYSEIMEDLDRLIQQIGSHMIGGIGWDNTGVGAGIYDFLRKVERKGIMCTPVEFSLQNKSAIYTNMKLLIEKNLRGHEALKIPFIKECDKQLSKLIFKKTSRGHFQVHHQKESDRDDYPDAIAGLCSLIIRPDVPNVSLEILETTGPQQYDASLEDRHACGNILEPWDEKCSFCGETLEQEII